VMAGFQNEDREHRFGREHGQSRLKVTRPKIDTVWVPR
jgi:hypothetical protein